MVDETAIEAAIADREPEIQPHAVADDLRRKPAASEGCSSTHFTRTRGNLTEPSGTREGVSDSGHSAYGGPCPPVGRHRYFHKVHALDPVMPNLERPDKAALEKAMEGHILAQAVLIGTYQKGR